ncbi:MAG: hypothetical protein Q8P27_00155 [Candidatus Peregrinibacteria bacterium]|nr:hypothetical protein [Candidatus Peregrinibacteria bacterium]
MGLGKSLMAAGVLTLGGIAQAADTFDQGDVIQMEGEIAARRAAAQDLKRTQDAAESARVEQATGEVIGRLSDWIGGQAWSVTPLSSSGGKEQLRFTHGDQRMIVGLPTADSEQGCSTQISGFGGTFTEGSLTFSPDGPVLNVVHDTTIISLGGSSPAPTGAVEAFQSGVCDQLRAIAHPKPKHDKPTPTVEGGPNS